MSNIINNNNILIILVNSDSEVNLRNKKINDFCKTFGERGLSNGANVEIIDLCLDYQNWQNKLSNSKIIEYQIKIKNVDKIVIFHSTSWQNVPSVLSDFLARVLTNTFAFERIRGQMKGLLNQKLLILAFGENSNFEQAVIYGNILDNFWQRVIANSCGFSCQFNYFGDFYKVSDLQIDKWKQKIEKLADQYSSKFSFEKALNKAK